jgi:hypothetical protein
MEIIFGINILWMNIPINKEKYSSRIIKIHPERRGVETPHTNFEFLCIN